MLLSLPTRPERRCSRRPDWLGLRPTDGPRSRCGGSWRGCARWCSGATGRLVPNPAVCTCSAATPASIRYSATALRALQGEALVVLRAALDIGVPLGDDAHAGAGLHRLRDRVERLEAGALDLGAAALEQDRVGGGEPGEIAAAHRQVHASAAARLHLRGRRRLGLRRRRQARPLVSPRPRERTSPPVREARFRREEGGAADFAWAGGCGAAGGGVRSAVSLV